MKNKMSNKAKSNQMKFDICQKSKISNKKASLSLSVNAIVVLVIGITVLGLALGFTKGMFGNLMGQINVPPPDIPATENDPIVFSTGSISISRGRDISLPVNFYNTQTGGIWMPSIQCQDDSETLISLDVSVIPQSVPAGEQARFELLLSSDNTADGEVLATAGVHLCVITFTSTGSNTEVTKQITITVK